MPHSIESVKEAAKRIFLQNYTKCILASFATGIFIQMVFNYVLDGTTQVQGALDTTAFYDAFVQSATYEEMYESLSQSIAAMVSSIGYASYMNMLHKYAVALLLTMLLQVIYQCLVIAPFQVGNCNFYLKAHINKYEYMNLITPFKENYLNVVKIQFIKNVKIILWSVLLFIPGIIKAYEYFMIPYLLADNPDMSAHEAFETSRIMMEGNKLNVFLLNLSFIGWMFLSVLSGGFVYILFAGSYIDASLANISIRIKAQYKENFESEQL